MAIMSFKEFMAEAVVRCEVGENFKATSDIKDVNMYSNLELTDSVGKMKVPAGKVFEIISCDNNTVVAECPSGNYAVFSMLEFNRLPIELQ